MTMLVKKLLNKYKTNVQKPKISKNDIGEMTSDEITIEIKNYLEQIKW
jgi:hypothetical protein